MVRRGVGASFGVVEHPVRGAVVRYVAGATVVLLLVVTMAVVVAGRIATREAVDHAELDARTLAGRYVAPLGVDALDPVDERGRLDDAFLGLVEQGALRQVKIWSDEGDGRGRIVYSDNRLYQGAEVGLGDVYRLFASGQAVARRVPPATGGSQRYPEGTYEVSVGFRDGRGTPFLFEAFLPTPEMAISRGELLQQWLPVVVGSLLLFAVATLPLAVGLARRAGAAESDRRRLAQRGLSDALADRRRMAQRLHDGPVQELSGAALVLDSVDREGLSVADRATLDRATQVLRTGVGELRSVGDELFPDAVSVEGLRAAVDELGRGSAAAGLDVVVHVDEDLGLDADATFLVYRVVREGLRNVVRHADATSASVEVVRVDAAATQGPGAGVAVTVRDDGQGFATPVRQGLGLRLLTHEVRGMAGSLQLEPAPDARGGACLRVWLPAESPE